MNLKHLDKLSRSVKQAAESFRGVDMDAYNALTSAAELIHKAKTVKHISSNPVPLSSLLGSNS